MIDEGEGLYSPDDFNYLIYIIEKHVHYDTIVIVRDEKDKITAVCRWNIKDNEATIHDLIIRKDKRNFKYIQRMLAYGLQMWPNINNIRWRRAKKYKYRMYRTYNIDKILKGGRLWVAEQK